MQEEPPLTTRKSTDQSRDKSKDKAPASLLPRPFIIGLEATWDPIENVAQRGLAHLLLSIDLTGWCIKGLMFRF